jgi:hypothetical protein
MVAELTSDLRRFEGLASGFSQSELLAWQLEARGNRDRIEIALLWGRTDTAAASSGWILAQGFRHPDDDAIWHRSLYYRELRSPLAHRRPGEDADGTWHAFQRYDHAPTVREVCEFAAVDFFNAEQHMGYRRVSGELRKRAWLRVTGKGPACGFTP